MTNLLICYLTYPFRIARVERDGTRAETRFRISPKRTSPFKSVGASVQSTAGSRGVRISLSNAGYTTFGDGVRVLATHSIRQFPPHFPSRASPCATRFRTSSTYAYMQSMYHSPCIYTKHFWPITGHLLSLFPRLYSSTGMNIDNDQSNVLLTYFAFWKRKKIFS